MVATKHKKVGRKIFNLRSYFLAAAIFFVLAGFFIAPQIQASSVHDAPSIVAADTQLPPRADDPAADCTKTSNSGDCNQIYFYINEAINFLSAGVGIVVVAMIIVGGIQYASAEDDPARVSAARTRVTNALLGLVAYIFLFGFLQWLVPGGIFK
jgi:hypothetical protein